VPTIGGVAVFLLMLLFAANLLLHLQARSAVRAVAFDTARRVAGESAADDPAVRSTAVTTARRVLGPAGSDAVFDWTGSGADTVRLRLEVPGPRLLPPWLAERAGLDRVAATAAVRVERFQEAT
jgi:hypothetical protein